MNLSLPRPFIIHYHIFKNAGSTLDAMLERNFGNLWGNFEKKLPTDRIDVIELAKYIQANPKLIAVSSHHAMMPPPEILGVEVIPILFFRHPLDRIRSVYEFERRQGQHAGPVSKGAEHAARLSFVDYLRWRLDTTVNGVVHNHQTFWMIHHARYNRHPIKDAEFEQACARLKDLLFFGLVEQFDESIALLRDLLGEREISFATEYVARNQSENKASSLEARLVKMQTELGEAMWQELIARNQRDMGLYDLAMQEFNARLVAAHPK